MSDAASIIATHAPAAGLSDEFRTFDVGGADASLGQRLRDAGVLMAPMAGVSDAAYRLMARAGGAPLAYTEMVSATGLHYGSEKTWELVVPHRLEPSIAVQLFGADPQHFAEAATRINDELGPKLALIDINMACPVPKVTKGGGGSALLDDPVLAARIVRACKASTSVPITIKIRRGRSMGDEVAPEFAKAMADAGAEAVAVHGRYASQMYRGDADWGVVARVVEAVDVPVIGTGDVRGAQEAVDMREQCDCAAVMVARGSYGNPWVFGNANDLMRGKTPHHPTVEERIEAFGCHVRLLDATGAHMARGRSLAGWYLRGLPHAAQWRGEAVRCNGLEDYLALESRMRAHLCDGLA